MSTWGTGLYQDDIAEGVKAYYMDQLHRGKIGPQITQELMKLYREAISDVDDAPIFWFSLADTQWNVGRLENFVKEQALYYISIGQDLKRWEMESPRFAKERAVVISQLKTKLRSKQPDEKKIAQYRLYHCNWKMGDVYAYRLSGEYAKEKGLNQKYLFFVKVGEQTWHPGHTVPVVYIYWTISESLLTIQDLKQIEFIPQFFTPKAYKNSPKKKTLYRLSFLTTSQKVLPKKNLTYIGNLSDMQNLKEEDPNPYCINWKDFENYIIDNFEKWDSTFYQ